MTQENNIATQINYTTRSGPSKIRIITKSTAVNLSADFKRYVESQKNEKAESSNQPILVDQLIENLITYLSTLKDMDTLNEQVEHVEPYLFENVISQVALNFIIDQEVKPLSAYINCSKYGIDKKCINDMASYLTTLKNVPVSSFNSNQQSEKMKTLSTPIVESILLYVERRILGGEVDNVE